MDYKNKNSNYHQYNGNLSRLFHNGEPEESDESRYKIAEIDNPNGWSFSELDMLSEMDFIIKDEYTLTTEVDTFSLSEMDITEDKQEVDIYKSEYGYVVESGRRYVFETFNKMIEYMDASISDINM
jgi:hypothetical protein